jgi:hypothetical protein
MKQEKDLTEAEFVGMTEIMERNEGLMLKEIEFMIDKHVQVTSSELRHANLELSDIQPANRDYYMAVVMSELFSKLHGGDKDHAGTIIYNLKGQAGLIS